MDKKRIRIISFSFVIFFILIDIAAASYIFTNSVRENSPDWTLESTSDIMSSDLSGDGDAFIYGSGNEIYFHYLYNPTPSRTYTLDARVKDVLISNNIKYFVATDIENNCYFFRYGPGPDLDLVYRVKFDGPVYLEGIVVLGSSLYNTRLLVRSEDSIYLFTSTSNEPVLSWDFDEPVNAAYISHYGDYVVAGTESGQVYFFRAFQESLEWQCTCDSAVLSISISPFAQFALIGCADGSVYLYNIEQQALIWKKSLGASIGSVFVRSSATESMALDATETLHLFGGDGEEINTIDGVDVSSMPYWSEFFLYSKDGMFNLQREDSATADWNYFDSEELRYIDSNYGSSTVMLTYKDNMKFFFEDQLMILGSRKLWAMLSLLVVVQSAMVFYMFYLQKSSFYQVINNREFLEFFVGALFGMLAVVVLARGTDIDYMNLTIGAISAGLASWQLSKVEGALVGSFLGYITGLFGSFAIGGAFGLYHWMGGAEQDIISSFFGTAFYGGLLGAFYSIVGIVVGLVIKDYFDEYRRKRRSSKV